MSLFPENDVLLLYAWAMTLEDTEDLDAIKLLFDQAYDFDINDMWCFWKTRFYLSISFPLEAKSNTCVLGYL